MKRSLLIGAVILLLATGCSAATDEAAEAPVEAATQPAEEMELSAPAAGDEAQSDDGGVGSGGMPADGLPLPDAQQVSTGDRIIKEGTVSLEVGEDAFDTAYAQVVEAARRLGGQVVASTSTSTDEGGTTGSVTVRVPVDRFEDLLVGVGRVGQVRSRDISAQDVSTEYVDLTSRKRHLEAQEAFYLGLLEQAAGVSDAIAVQQQLDGIQAQIEQIQGRLNWLDDRTSFSTLTVQLFEPGAPLPQVADPDQRPSLARYWASAKDGFVNVVGAMLFLIVLLTPIMVPVAIGLAVWAQLRRRRVPPAQPAAAD